MSPTSSCSRNPENGPLFDNVDSSVGDDDDAERAASSSFGLSIFRLLDEESESSGVGILAACSAINLDVSPPSGVSDRRL